MTSGIGPSKAPVHIQPRRDRPLRMAKAWAANTQRNVTARPRIRSNGSMSLPIALLIGAYELGLGQHMSIHRRLEFGLGQRFGGQPHVERIQLMEIAVPSDRRAWAIEASIFVVVDPLDGARGQTYRRGVLANA